MKKQITKQQIIEDLQKFKNEHNKIPLKKKYLKYGTYGSRIISKLFGNWNQALKETFGQTNIQNRYPKKQVQCKTCNKEFIKTISQIQKSKSGNSFCSKACAASYNNISHPKRKFCKKCKNCDNLIAKRNTFCPPCIKNGKHLTNGQFVYEKTIKDYTDKYRHVRTHARKITSKRPQKCAICGYDKHVETCHIKEISKFSPDTLIGVVNDPSNLIILCPNHHWELDNKNFSILKTGPTQDRTEIDGL
jgi:hypothetical protein